MTNFKTIKFTDGDISLDVRVSVEDNAIWLSINEMALLFGYERSTISRRVQSTYNDLLSEGCAKCAKMHLSLCKSGKKVMVPIYRQDVIKAVGEKFKNDIFDKVLSFVNQKYNSQDSNSDIIIYNNGSISLDVSIDPSEDTVWLTQNQISQLFETTVSNISMHIKNIFADGELEPSSVIKDFLNTAQDGKQYLVSFYNLDLILAIGYRIKGKRAIEFRKWTSNVLKQYLIKGYAINDNRASVTAENFLRLENEIHSLKSRITNLEKEDPIIKEKIILNGEVFDAFELICSILSKAKERIIIIDPFFERKCLSYLKEIPSKIEKIIYKSKKIHIAPDVINKFNRQYGNITIIENNNIHDRFIIVDNSICYSIGTSLNFIGEKMSAIIKIETKEIIDSILNHIV